MLENTLNPVDQNTGDTNSDKALSNIRVLDLSRILAGPWCAKPRRPGRRGHQVERPGAGDDTRAWGPPWLPGQDEESAMDSSYYSAGEPGQEVHHGGFHYRRGQALIKRLARTSDVFIENFKVGNLERYGLDYESIRKENPSIIYCSITGFGQDGPFAHRPGYDFVFQGWAA